QQGAYVVVTGEPDDRKRSSPVRREAARKRTRSLSRHLAARRPLPNTPPRTMASTRWPTTGWTSAPTPERSPTRPGQRPAKGSPTRRTSSPPPNGHCPSSSTARGPRSRRTPPCQAYTAASTLPSPQPTTPKQCCAPSRRRSGHRPGPRRETSPPPPWAPRTTNGVTTARVQRRSMAGPTLQRLPGRPQRIPGDPAQPAPPRRPHRLHHQGDHHHPRPALQLLTEELNATPAVMPTDPRPLTYQLAEAQISTVNGPLLAEV